MPFATPNVTDIPSLFQYANTPTFGWFWPIMLLTAWIVVYFTLSQRTDSKRALAATSFFTGIMAAFMFVTSLINELTMIISIVMAIASFLILLFSDASQV